METADRTLHLLIVRHGQTVWNAEDRLQGQTDIPLSDAGRAQARRLGRRFAGAWASGSMVHGALPGPPDAVYVSDLCRAQETASLALEPVAISAPLYTTPVLRERGFGVWEGLTLAAARARFGSERSHHNEGESHDAVEERMRAALEMIWAEQMQADGTRMVLIVGHGGSLRQLACLVCGLDRAAMRAFHLDNTGLSVLELQGPSLGRSKGRILLWNDCAHLTNGAME